MGKVLTARNAVIRTATAEIKALTIEGKQVTMAVFRQLLRRDLIDRSTGELLGVPWGLVNYFWADCGWARAHESHLHVVWQDGDDLRRDCVTKARSGAFDDRDALYAISSAARMATRLVVETEGHADPTEFAGKLVAGRGWNIEVPERPRRCEGCGAEDDARAARLRSKPSYHADLSEAEWRQQCETEARRISRRQHSPPIFWWPDLRDEDLINFARACVREYPGASPRAIIETLWDQHESRKRQSVASNAAWTKSYELVAGLDQLFIAV